MNCPKCNKELEIMWQGDTLLLPDLIKRAEVVGHCSECDFDATWMIDTHPSGEVQEHGLRRYFFG